MLSKREWEVASQRLLHPPVEEMLRYRVGNENLANLRK